MKKTVRHSLAAILLAVLLCMQAFAATVLVPGGNTVGIRVFSDGVVITEVEKGSVAEQAGLRCGDRILSADGTAVKTVEDLKAAVEKAESSVELEITRNGKDGEFEVFLSQNEENQLGISVRDGISGIGTVTFYDPESGCFGALGHGITDFDGSSLFPLRSGYLVYSAVSQVQKGKNGAPGALEGSFDVSHQLGTVEENRKTGIFGQVSEIPAGSAIPVAAASEVHLGKASILSNVSGSDVEEFEITIDRINPDSQNGRDLLITITDPLLLEKTGGIVQGMSGSPILQDGKLVGAVTHVLVNDAARGYGILIEKMIEG